MGNDQITSDDDDERHPEGDNITQEGSSVTIGCGNGGGVVGQFLI